MDVKKNIVTAEEFSGDIPFVEISGYSSFDAPRTFDCGQSFRFNKTEDGMIEGVAYGRCIRIAQSGGKTRIYNSTMTDYKNIWEKYLGLDEDYTGIQCDICEKFGKYGNTIYDAVKCGDGIRILRQESWEALCSFIISQNNNIPRIKKIIEALSAGLGEPFSAFGNTYFAFPTAEKIASAGIFKLSEYRMGFRAKYLADAADKYLSGEIDFDFISEAAPAQAAEMLMKINGVGPKVATCTLLYGFHKTSSFPIDVWMKRVIEKYYPCGFCADKLGDYAGIAQQYLFYYERYKTSGKEKV